MATVPERIATLEAQVQHLVSMIDEHRNEARQAVKTAHEDRDAMRADLKALTTLAADGKSRLAALFWLATVFSGLFGGAITYTVKTWAPFWLRT